MHCAGAVAERAHAGMWCRSDDHEQHSLPYTVAMSLGDMCIGEASSAMPHPQLRAMLLGSRCRWNTFCVPNVT